MSLKKFIERVSLEEATVDAGVPGESTKVDLEKPEVIDSESIDKDIETALDLEPSESIEKELASVEKVTVALEQYHSILTTSLERGGLRPEEGQMLNVALEHFDSVLGLDSGVLSMEDFGGKMSRREATQVSLENVSDKIKAAGQKAWAFIQELFKKLMEQVNGAKAKSQRLGEYFSHSAEKVKTISDPETTGVKFDVKMSPGIRSVKSYASAAKDVMTAIDQITAESKRVTEYIDNVGRLFKQEGKVTDALIQRIKDLDLYKDLKDNRLDIAGLYAIEVSEGKYVPKLKPANVDPYSDETDNIKVSFSEYMALAGSGKRLSAKTEAYWDSNSATIKKHNAVIDEIVKDTDGLLEDTTYQLGMELAALSRGVTGLTRWVYNAESGVANLLRQVEKELDKRASGKGSSDDE